MPDSPAVVVRGLVKRYDGRAVVDGLDLVAERGAVTAVLGPNGAGKTTSVECCEGLRTPDAGEVRVLGLDPVAQARALRPRVGVMLQDGGLPTGVRALEMLRHVAAMYADPRDVDELAERLGLESFARTTVRRLSGGQRQRLALAAAVVGRPEVVFLDEPSAGMDPQSRHAVWDLVRELRGQGVGIVLTTHLMDEAEDLADHVYVVDHGQVIASGATAELLAAGETAVRVRTRPGLDVAALATVLAGAAARGTTTTSTGAATTSRADGASPAPFVVTEDEPGAYTVRGDVSPVTVAATTRWLADQGALLTQLTVGRRTLEDVFLDLTGRHLR
ncbi:ABC-2 type transport system ATP-binding protein [Sediminihabitans luteus]|uniref:ABC-2 type transport system ATP-binding protein n=1 Tax=Sediminihabitans luteus TaxID=1138585 RepID=A0A2M9CR66_9CELL|nr:ABC transporter ATP-binding protein [Sediminihabitans luteus]PJJ74422.1 ABC-2 type transport system ATP-binding protein [Sediminihabitans luteus]GIJ00211.1 spermidine/putrescine ABC transporter ATP-binding protein [Sediminihabitans luteus]